MFNLAVMIVIYELESDEPLLAYLLYLTRYIMLIIISVFYVYFLDFLAIFC